MKEKKKEPSAPKAAKKKKKDDDDEDGKKKKRRKKDPNAPKRAMSSFMYFSQSEREVSQSGRALTETNIFFAIFQILMGIHRMVSAQWSMGFEVLSFL